MKILRKLLLNPWTALITLALLIFARSQDPVFVESIRLRYFDTLITSKTPSVNNVWTVNIDEQSLEQLGQWPLPRAAYARIVQDLYDRHAGLVVLNVLMPEADRMGQDAELAQTLTKYPVILTNVAGDRNRNQPRNPGAAILNSEFADRIISYPGIIANVPVLEQAAAGVGTVNTLPEIDGVTRRMPLLFNSNGQLYPSLGMETLRVAAGDSTFQVKLFEGGIEKMRIPAFGPIATDPLGRIWIDWSQQNSQTSLNNLPNDFAGAIVIVGPSAAGIANPVPTAKGSVWPQEVQAAVIGTMANGVVIQRPDYADGVEILAMAIAGVILLLLTRWTYVGLTAVLLMSVGGVCASQWMFTKHLWLFDSTAFVTSIVLVSLHAYGVKFLAELQQKLQIKRQFGTYLSPALVAKLQKNPELLQLGGDERELSIMFTDVRGFTAISEYYGTNVQGLTNIMNRYMTAMTAKILENNGTLDKYIGDAQMAFWNAPVDESQHAHQAVKTGLAMMNSLDEFNASIASEGVPPFGMGLGINTGVVVVGNMGSSQRFDYTCLGDSVNLASRLEGQSKPYGVKIVLGQRTAELVKDQYFVLPLDTIAVKGKKIGVEIFTVLCAIDQAPLTWKVAAETHICMLHHYRNQNWANVDSKLAALKGTFGGAMDQYYEMWAQRVQDLRHQNLPTDWDCVFRATSK